MENPDGTPTWPEAQVPAVEPDDEAWFRRLAMAAVWDPRNVDAELAARTQQVKEIMTPKTPHISKLLTRTLENLSNFFQALEYIAVHPENQGMGIGTALVKSGMDQADKLGLDIFVHAFEEGCPLYKKMGFRLLAEFIQDYSQCGGTKRCGAYFYLYEHGSRGASV